MMQDIGCQVKAGSDWREIFERQQCKTSRRREVNRSGKTRRVVPPRERPIFWNEFASIMDFSRFHASTLRNIEICLDIMRHIGKIYPAGEFKQSAGSVGGWFRDRQKPGLEVIRQKGRA
jgi:hypothetical protein